jgi:hypothetical protein
MTEAEIDKRIEEAMNRISLRVEYHYIVWLLNNLTLPKVRDNILYMPLYPLDRIDEARDIYKRKLDFISGQAMRAGIYLEMKNPIIPFESIAMP